MLPLLLLLQSVPADTTAPLTVRYIMRGVENTGREPSDIRWSPDGRYIHFRWLPPGTDWRAPLKPYRVRAVAGAVPEELTPAAADAVAPLLAEGSDSRDRRWRAVVTRGDLYLVDRRAGTARRLTETAETESDPVLSPDGRTLYFTREGNLYSLGVADGALVQLTDIRRGPRPADSAAATGQRGWLAQENRALLGAVRDRLAADSLGKAERARRDSAWGAPLWLDAGEEVDRILPSPVGGAAIVLTSIPAKGARRTAVPDYLDPSGYTTEIPGRRNVGDAEGRRRVGLLRLPRGEVTWIAPIPGDSTRQVSGLALRGWDPSGRRALLWAVSADFKRRFLQSVAVPAAGDTAAVRPILVDSLRDSAWVGGPCAWCAGWVDDSTAWFVSERSGYAHLYSAVVGGAEARPARALTAGRWEVLQAELSPDRREFWMHTSETTPYERHFWRMPASGGARTQVTRAEGGHDVTVSPDGRLLADVYSTSNTPPELFVLPFRAGAAGSRLTHSPTAEWERHRWVAPPIEELPMSDGVTVPARVYLPERLGASRNGAAVIFVHGAGYLHNVHRWWSDYFREYQFHHLLAQRGYVVLDLDYRGSAGYGRDWRTAIYRHMGGRDLQDQVDASAWLTRTYGIPAERVGIYGGSYGGFLTQMALFTAPKSFGAGAALRSVTDWAYYNHGYTAEILNRPQDDSLAYRRSSPIYFAEGLEDPLLIAHGLIDTNVHAQDDIRLVERLIELGKTGWEFAVYPAEDHGFVRPESWTDEYTRILSLFERTIGARR